MKKQTKKQLKEFNNEVIDLLEYYGATKENETTYTMNSEKIGLLTIRLESDPSSVYSICTEFNDTTKAIQYFNIKSFNGKMHSYEWNPEPCISFLDGLLDNYNQINGINSHVEYEVSKAI